MSEADPEEDIFGWNHFWRLWAAGTWEPATRAVLDELLEDGDLFVDVGAWIGPTTLWALGRKATVIAIEPDPVACAELRRQLRFKGPQVEIWEGAVVATPGWTWPSLEVNARDGGFLGDSMSTITTNEDADGHLVPGYSIDAIVGTRRPRLVKVDIEGYELELAPVLAPWCVEVGSCLQISWHGTVGERAWFEGFEELRWTDDPWGDAVAIMERRTT